MCTYTKYSINYPICTAVHDSGAVGPSRTRTL